MVRRIYSRPELRWRGLVGGRNNRQIISTEKLGDEFLNFAELHWCVLYIGELVLSYLMYLTANGNGTVVLFRSGDLLAKARHLGGSEQ